MALTIQSKRLRLSQYETADVDAVFDCITPGMTRFMPWEPPASIEDYRRSRLQRLQANDPNSISLVVRRLDTNECLGLTSIEDLDLAQPEVGLWLKEAVHGQGYGREVIEALVAWASEHLGKDSFIYPVAAGNKASRSIAERLGGEIVGTRTGRKYHSAVYSLPARRLSPA